MALKRITLITASALLAAGTIAAGSAATAQADDRHGEGAGACAGLFGKSEEITFDNGLDMRFDFSADGTKLTGTVEAAGSSGGNPGVTNTVDIAFAQVAKNVYFTNWNEHGGLTVSLTQNLKARTAQAYWSFPSGGDVRLGQLHTGTLRCLS